MGFKTVSPYIACICIISANCSRNAKARHGSTMNDEHGQFLAIELLQGADLQLPVLLSPPPGLLETAWIE